MRVLLVLSTRKVHRKENLELFRALQAQEKDLVWSTGTTFDMYRTLDRGELWLDLVNPDSFDTVRKHERFAADAFDVALVDLSFDLTEDQSPSLFGGGIANRSLDFQSYDRPSGLVRELTMRGTVCIGISRSRRLLQELQQEGAVMTFGREQLVRDYAIIMREATRLVRENCDDPAAGLKALTVREPFAWAMFNAGKDMENRNWPTRVRGTIAIHTAEELPEGYYARAKKFISAIAKKTGLKGVHVPPVEKLTHGAIIGLVDVVDCVEKSDSAWFEGPIAVCLANPRLLPKPIPCKGKRRYFRVPPEVARQIGKR